MYFNRLFIDLLKQDNRYKAEAYTFVFEVLDYAQTVLKLGRDDINEPISGELAAEYEESEESEESDSSEEPSLRRHITGQELCHAAREYALQQYGFMAKTVLETMGIRRTDDIGQIVYNLIGIGLMRKTPTDSQEDFNGVFDWSEVFREEYKIH